MIRSFLYMGAFLSVATAFLPSLSLARDAAFLPPETSVTATAEEAAKPVAKEIASEAPKDVKSVNFGVIKVGDKVVRTAGIVNNAGDPLTISSIDTIEAANGLQRLDQGCAVGKELAPGASCGIVLQWEPKAAGTVSTDLVVHHTGKMGFTVVAIRGEARDSRLGAPTARPATVAPVRKESGAMVKNAKGESVNGLQLIGTVGDRAVFMLPGGDTFVVPTGNIVQMKEGAAKLVSVGPYSADILCGSQKITLMLKTMPVKEEKTLKQVKGGEALRHKGNFSSGKKK